MLQLEILKQEQLCECHLSHDSSAVVSVLTFIMCGGCACLKGFSLETPPIQRVKIKEEINGWGDHSVVKSLLGKHGNLSSNPQHGCRSQAAWHTSVRGAKTAIPGACWPPNLAKRASSGFNKGSNSKYRVRSNRGRFSRARLSQNHIYAHLCAHTHTESKLPYSKESSRHKPGARMKSSGDWCWVKISTALFCFSM